MFGNIGQLMNLMRNAGQLKEQMQAMKGRLAAARVVGEAGGGQVRVTFDGRGEIVGVQMDPALIRTNDVELIEELVCSAVRDAAAKGKEAMQQEMQNITGGLNLSGLDKLFGGGG